MIRCHECGEPASGRRREQVSLGWFVDRRLCDACATCDNVAARERRAIVETETWIGAVEIDQLGCTADPFRDRRERVQSLGRERERAAPEHRYAVRVPPAMGEEQCALLARYGSYQPAERVFHGFTAHGRRELLEDVTDAEARAMVAALLDALAAAAGAPTLELALRRYLAP